MSCLVCLLVLSRLSAACNHLRHYLRNHPAQSPCPITPRKYMRKRLHKQITRIEELISITCRSGNNSKSGYANRCRITGGRSLPSRAAKLPPEGKPPSAVSRQSLRFYIGRFLRGFCGVSARALRQRESRQQKSWQQESRQQESRQQHSRRSLSSRSLGSRSHALLREAFGGLLWEAFCRGQLISNRASLDNLSLLWRLL